MTTPSGQIIKETATYIIIRYHYGVDPQSGEDMGYSDSKQQKLLCIGGPFSTQHRAAYQLGNSADTYCQYNRGEFRRKIVPNKAVYIHDAILAVWNGTPI